MADIHPGWGLIVMVGICALIGVALYASERRSLTSTVTVTDLDPPRHWSAAMNTSASLPLHTRAASVGAVRTTTIRARGTDFPALEAGPRDGPLALCLHGFPDTAHTWRHLLPQLASRGYHAVAPLMRGYAPTSASTEPSCTVAGLVADATAMHAALSADGRAVLIGHDWGASAAYGAVNLAPDRWSRLITASVPPTGIQQIDFASLEQMHRSWYAFLLALPEGPAIAWRTGLTDTLWSLWSPTYNADDDLAHLRQALPTEDHLRQVAGLYRNALGTDPTPNGLEAEQQALTATVAVPTLYLHGAEDGCIDPALALEAKQHLPLGSHVEMIAGAGHFPHLETPTRVAELVLDFLHPPITDPAPQPHDN